MEQGIWKKYEKTVCKPEGERASYHDLYEDLKDSRRSWEIAQSLDECKAQLCGVDLRTTGRVLEAGDIYVYYVLEKEKLIPILYFKIVQVYDDNELMHYIEYNGHSDYYNSIIEIGVQYLPEVIRKLKEIDSEKNQFYIEELESRYYNHQHILELQSKVEYTEEELLFLYKMYNYNFSLERIYKTIVSSKIESRDLVVDFERFSEEGKAKLFLSIHGLLFESPISISSKKVMTLIVENGDLSCLCYASSEILKDKNFIIGLLQVFAECGEFNPMNTTKLNALPECYRTDPEILSLILYYGGDLVVSEWLAKSPEEKLKSPEFVYPLLEAFIRGKIRDGKPCCDASNLLRLLPNEILNDIENHIMFGPEQNPQKGLWSGEDLKQISYQKLLNHRAKVLQYRKEH